MTGNNTKLGLVNANVYAKFGQILSSHSQDNEWKQNVGRTEGQNNGTTEGQGESSIAPLFQSRAIINYISHRLLNFLYFSLEGGG